MSLQNLSHGARHLEQLAELRLEKGRLPCSAAGHAAEPQLLLLQPIAATEPVQAGRAALCRRRQRLTRHLGTLLLGRREVHGGLSQHWCRQAASAPGQLLLLRSPGSREVHGNAWSGISAAARSPGTSLLYNGHLGSSCLRELDPAFGQRTPTLKHPGQAGQAQSCPLPAAPDPTPRGGSHLEPPAEGRGAGGGHCSPGAWRAPVLTSPVPKHYPNKSLKHIYSSPLQPPKLSSQQQALSVLNTRWDSTGP